MLFNVHAWPFWQVDTLLSQHGRVETMWMPTIKNLAYVIYESADVAEDTRCAQHPAFM